MRHKLVLGLHPYTRGFGWALFEDARTPLDWGATHMVGCGNAAIFGRMIRILDRSKPAIIALEEFENEGSRRAARIRAFCQTIVVHAGSHDIAVHRYTRGEIGLALGQQLRTRQDVAKAVAARLPALRPRLPRKRRVWESEHPRMALFCAAACALAHYARSES